MRRASGMARSAPGWLGANWRERGPRTIRTLSRPRVGEGGGGISVRACSEADESHCASETARLTRVPRVTSDCRSKEPGGLDRVPFRVLFSAHVDSRHVLRLLLLCDPFTGPELERAHDRVVD